MTAVATGTEGLQPQDLVLTIFGTYVRGGEQVWSGGMVEILESLDFTTGSARAALARLVNRDLLARTRDGRRAFYGATQRAEALLAQGDRRIFSFGREEPRVQPWTVLWHAIPEAERVARSRFASQLRFLGFGSVQDATWVAARDREQEVLVLLRQLGIERYASVLVGRVSTDVPPVALVAQAWDLEDARRRYEAFLGEFDTLRTARGRRGIDAAGAFRRRTLLLHRFRGFPFIDPELPPGVDTVHDLRGEVVACFDEVYAALREPATKHFWAVVGTGERRPAGG
jgi:phenylacetic acid degradation operon negative regulatory protein